jgi:hypothetical protein
MSRPRTTNSHLPKYVTVIHGSYWYRPPKAKACRIGPEGDYTALYRFLARLGDAAPVGETLSDCFDRYAREVLPGKAPKTRRGNMAAIAKLRATFGHMRPDEVKPRDIGRYLSVGAPIARNKEIALLSHVYTKAVSRWYVAESNPCRNVERNESRPRTRYITDTEFEAFRNAVPERLRVAMDLALLTGQRQGDLLQLEWSAVSEEGVFFQQGKTGKKLLVGMSPGRSSPSCRARSSSASATASPTHRTDSGRSGSGSCAVTRRPGRCGSPSTTSAPSRSATRRTCKTPTNGPGIPARPRRAGSMTDPPEKLPRCDKQHRPQFRNRGYMKNSSQVAVNVGGSCGARTRDKLLKRQRFTTLQPADRALIREAALLLISRRLPSSAAATFGAVHEI